MEYLQNRDDIFLKQLCQFTEFQMYQPLDYIITQGEMGQEIYFLIEGKANVVLTKNLEIEYEAVLEQGDFFGEESLLNVCLRKRSVIAASYCSFYILRKQHFDSVLEDFPSEKESVASIRADHCKNWDTFIRNSREQ